MDAETSLKLNISYDQGIQMTVTPEPDAASPLHERMRAFRASPNPPAFRRFVDALRDNGHEVEMGFEAGEIYELAEHIQAQDEAREAWLRDTREPFVKALRTSLPAHNIEGAAFLAFRRKALLADPRCLNPIATAIAAMLIIDQELPGRSHLVVAPSSRHALWNAMLEEYFGSSFQLVSGTRKVRKQIYATGAHFMLIPPEEVAQDRKDVSELKPASIIVDEVSREWGVGNKLMIFLHRIKPERIIAMTSLDPVVNPEGLYSILSLLAPSLAGPRVHWDRYYAPVREGGDEGEALASQLRARIADYVLRRDPAEMAPEVRRRVSDVYRVPLSRRQANAYHRHEKALVELLSQRELSPINQLKVDEELAALRRICDSMRLLGEGSDSSKLEELRAILLEETQDPSRRIVVFSRWEEMTRQIAEILRPLKAGHVRSYKHLTAGRRRELVKRFLGGKARIFISTDIAVQEGPIDADVLIHFDAPWNPEIVTWRRTQIRNPEVDEIALLAADTLETGLWAPPFPSSTHLKEGGEESGEPPSVRIFEDEGEALRRLKALIGLSNTTDQPFDVPADQPTEKPESDKLEASSAKEAPAQAKEALAQAKEAPAQAKEADPSGEVPSSSSPEQKADDLGAEASGEGSGGRPSTSDEDVGRSEAFTAEDSRESSADEAPADVGKSESGGVPAKEEEKMETRTQPEGETDAIESPADGAAEIGDDSASADGRGGEGDAFGGERIGEEGTAAEEPELGPPGALENTLTMVEIPLKAVNRILAGIPGVGESLSRINAMAWEVLTAPLRKH